MKSRSDRLLRGFTLIELLVVVLIIGILAAVALPQYNRAVLRSRFVQAQTIAKSFSEAASRYYLANGKPPRYWENLDITAPSGFTVSAQEGGGLSGNGIYCDLMNNLDENIVCFVHSANKPYQVAYVQFFSPSNRSRECWARKDNSDAQSVCKGLGGIEAGNVSSYHCQLVGGCTRYTLF